MRLKNIKGAKEKVENSKYVINNPEKYRGKYKKLFTNTNTINIEIGMGKGDFIIEMAKKNPNINFIGIEMFDSVILRAVQKLEGLEIPNLKLMRFDATEIENVFDKEIDTIYLNFSDPWPKNRHAHRRLTSERFLKRYDKVFEKDCHIIQKTDNRHLFEYSVMSYVESGYKIKDISLNLHEDLKDKEIDNTETEYEKKFSSLGLPIYMIEVYK
ncbi:MAG: tRNA (guanosine(46)-N7)-methyltransferase TrmB [Bacilli bacterium]|nr:tRNA (guanosine(46)-N7)-methyltransferase TrmB [Bacilli bacterium]MBR3209854.1 tRNA (guanosine(46)-N7)-methyltransferase TrmB [Bacilli bacterium]